MAAPSIAQPCVILFQTSRETDSNRSHHLTPPLVRHPYYYSPSSVGVCNPLSGGHIRNFPSVSLSVSSLSGVETGIYLASQCQASPSKDEFVHPAVLVSVLRDCKKLDAAEEALSIVALSGLDSDTYVGTNLIQLYTRLNNLREACRMFNKIEEPNVITWTSIISAHAKLGQEEQAIQLYYKMQENGVQPDGYALVSALNACSSIASLQQGMRIHDYAVKSGLESSVYIGNALVSLYVNCGNLEAASTVFSQVLGRDVITWSTLMGGYAQEGQMQETFKLLAEMQQHDVKPNIVSYIHILDGCANADGFEEGGMLIHASIVEDGIDDDELVGSVLIDMYGKWGMVEEAYKVFDRLPHRDAVTWTSMIGAFTQAGDEYAQYALKLYEQMELEGTQPNNIMYLSVLKLCAHLSDSWYGHEIHHRIVASGCDRDIMVASSLIDMYIKAGEIDDGFHVFEGLPKRNVVVWSSIIMGYVELGFSDTALYLFQQMQKEGIEPDVTSIVCILKACGCVAALEQGKIIHGYVIKRGFEMDVHVGSALICMYSSCGSLDDGVDVFEGLQVRNVVVFNAMITGFAKNNNFSLALKTYSAMEGCECKPNGVTYLSLLTACSNLGLVKEGCDLFKSMKEHVNLLELDHYNTLVDIFGHAGLLVYSEDLLETIPFQANSVGWLSLLSSCRTFRAITVGRRCFERVVTLEPMNSAAYVLMSRIYDLVGLYEDAIGLEIVRRSRKAWKLPGTSCIEVDQKVHRFTVQEHEHPRSMEIKTRIRNIIQKWKQEQSLPQNIVDAGIVVEDDEFCEHCEMSAVGFGLISTPQGKTLRITKNLCICSNCHSVLKFISKSEKRRIVLIDAFCVHDFKDGVCTCSNFLYRDLSYR